MKSGTLIYVCANNILAFDRENFYWIITINTDIFSEFEASNREFNGGSEVPSGLLLYTILLRLRQNLVYIRTPYLNF